MSMPSVTVRKGYMKKALVNGTIAVCVAASATPVMHQYSQKVSASKTYEANSTEKNGYIITAIQKSSRLYVQSKPYVKQLVILKSGTFKEEIKVLEDTTSHEASSEVSIPVNFAGKLPIGVKNDFVFNNDRKAIDISHKVEEISVPVSYGGRLPVRRESV